MAHLITNVIVVDGDGDGDGLRRREPVDVLLDGGHDRRHPSGR